MVARTDNTMVARKGQTIQWYQEKGQNDLTMICKTLHRKLMIGQHEPYGKQWVKSGAPNR